MLARALLLTMLMSCWSTRDIEKEAAWRDVPLEVAPSAVKDLVLVRGDPKGDAVYTRSSENARWGRARISVRYHFWKDRLWKVEVRTGDSRALLDAIKADYGTPPFDKPWTWEGEEVRMHFQGHEYDSAAEVTIVSKDLERDRNLAR